MRRAAGASGGLVTVAVGLSDPWEWGAANYVITLASAGPVRLEYVMGDGAEGRSWFRHVGVRERKRRRVLRKLVECGALEGAGMRGGPGVPAPYGWLYVAAEGRTAVVHLPPDGCIGGVPVGKLLGGLVPRATWRGLRVLRDRAWQEWANASHGGLRPVAEATIRDGGPRLVGGVIQAAANGAPVDAGPAPLAGADTTMRDATPPATVISDGTVVDAASMGPDDVRVAGAGEVGTGPAGRLPSALRPDTEPGGDVEGTVSDQASEGRRW
ncbi:hypothetical protein [Actinomadura oligospora]|uniref:hypothetical protein n=1 Tax=Actinomadura oligospora TaxID=111804 RepID=UPI000479DD93|nr:hypothetical protein [Actinomadura oligospora]